MRVEPQSTKQAQLQISQMIRPMLEAIRNILRNFIIWDMSTPTRSIELKPISLSRSTLVCYQCKRDVIRTGDFWMTIDVPYKIQKTCNQCRCAPDQHIEIDYKLDYAYLERCLNYIHADEMTHLELLLRASAQFAYFLINIACSSKDDPFWMVHYRCGEQYHRIISNMAERKLQKVDQLQLLDPIKVATIDSTGIECVLKNGSKYHNGNFLHVINKPEGLHLSILSGLVNVKGIASLVNDPYPLNEYTRYLLYSYTYKEEQVSNKLKKSQKMSKSLRIPASANHIITGVNKGIDVIIVLQLPSESEFMRKIDEVLQRICSQLKNEQTALELNLDDENILGQITDTVVYSNIPSLMALFTVRDIREKQCKLQKLEKIQQQIIERIQKWIIDLRKGRTSDSKKNQLFQRSEHDDFLKQAASLQENIDILTAKEQFISKLTEQRFEYCNAIELNLTKISLQNGIDFSNDEKHDYEMSWSPSVKESNRLIEYIQTTLIEYRLNSEWKSIKRVQVEINHMIYPMLQIRQNILRNNILYEMNITNKSIEMLPKAIHRSASICLSCDFYPIIVGKFCVAKNILHEFLKKCLSCSCNVDKHIPINCIINYEYSNAPVRTTQKETIHMPSQFTMAGAEFDYFLVHITHSSKTNPFLSGLERIIDEENKLCESQTSNHLNVKQVKNLIEIQCIYEKRMKDVSSNQQLTDLSNIDKRIGTIRKYPMIEKQLEIMKQTQEMMTELYEVSED
ncbi:unnamed protein product [Rotaria magnacalcarata]|uniref:Uncharacterized protein n=2 Tax=Rotaria magnacalcarata TaxID=392030 RepID=A0A8S2K4B0_9BILA|nr:unnamed protein product [Rotaria magnacalcarata]